LAQNDPCRGLYRGCLCNCLGLVPGAGHPQTPTRSFQKIDSYPNEPLKIINIKSAGKSLSLGEKFSGGDDWLKAAQLTLKNVSTKDIVFIEIDFEFPDTKSSGNEMSFPFRLGSRPGTINSNPPVVLKGDAEITLNLDEKEI
jgi:hypothetical protein